MRLEKWSKDLGFEKFDGILSFLDFEFVTLDPLRLLSSFSQSLGSSSGCSGEGVYEAGCW